MYHDSSSTATWSFRRENTNLDNRSLTSTDAINWSNPGYDYKLRSIVYSNAQLAAGLVTGNAQDKQLINTSNLFTNNSCQLIAVVKPAGASPLTDSVTARVWIESGVPQYAGKPFVARHYQIAPSTNPSTATGRVTLYFTQAEFTAFNAHPGSAYNLPTGPNDAAGKANLHIARFAGVSSDGSGLPASYGGAPIPINPADSDIVWNATASRWEVSFDVTGFSGFIVQTDLVPLPLLVESFSGYPQEAVNVLSWKISCLDTEPSFVIERSANGVNYAGIGSASADKGCNQNYVFNDNKPLQGKNYYRIRIIENGMERYTKFILLQTGKSLASTLYPSILKKGENIQVVCSENEGILRIVDGMGRQIYNRRLAKGVQNITLPATESGLYFYTIQSNQDILSSGKLLVQ